MFETQNDKYATSPSLLFCFVCFCVFNVPSTAKVIRRQGHGSKKQYFKAFYQSSHIMKSPLVQINNKFERKTVNMFLYISLDAMLYFRD